MLSKRSKILIAVASFTALVFLLGRILNAAAWQKEVVEDWYVEWILLGAWIAIAALSVVVDLLGNDKRFKRPRPPLRMTNNC